MEAPDEFNYKVIVLKEGDHLFNFNKELRNNSEERNWCCDNAIKALNKKDNYCFLFLTIFWPEGNVDYRYFSNRETNIYVLTDDDLMIKDIIE